jgi:hypothetical protein
MWLYISVFLKFIVTQLIILNSLFHINKTSITKLCQNILSLVQVQTSVYTLIEASRCVCNKVVV